MAGRENAATRRLRAAAARHDARIAAGRMVAAWYLDAAAAAMAAILARDAGDADPASRVDWTPRGAVFAEAAASADRMTAALGMLAPDTAADVAALAWRMVTAILEGMPDPPALEAAP